MVVRIVTRATGVCAVWDYSAEKSAGRKSGISILIPSGSTSERSTYFFASSLALWAAYHLKFLNPFAGAHFGDINVALRVHRQEMRIRKFPNLVSRAAETRKEASAGAIEDINLLVVL